MVTPPIKTPKKEATECNMSGWSQAMKEAIEVVMAAKPTKEWKRATV
jgi:hypothetical protein